MKRTLSWTGIAGTVILVVNLVSGCSNNAPGPLSVHTSPVTSARVDKALTISGVLAPDQTANVYSRASGTAATVVADVGQSVKAGTVLLQVETKELNAQLKLAEAQVQAVNDQAAQAKLGIQTAQTNLDLAQKSYDRIDALFKSQTVAKSQYDDAQSKLQLAKNAVENADEQYKLLTSSQLEAAVAQLNLIQVQISNGTITTPITGMITNRNINPGEVVNQGTPLFTVADTRVLRLQGTVSQDAVPLLSVGDRARVQIDGFPGREFSGTISQIGPVGAATGQYFPVVITVSNDGKLLAGMTAVASLMLSAPEGLVVPSSALTTINGGSYVYVVEAPANGVGAANGTTGKDGTTAQKGAPSNSGGGAVTVRRVPVSVGLRNATVVQVTGDLRPGELVVDTNVGTVRDGMTVRTDGKAPESPVNNAGRDELNKGA